jgi:hypothetical protein
LRDLQVSAVCLDSIVAHPELSERDAAQEEPPCLRLSAENECEKEQPTWQRSCRSIVRRDPRLSPLARARPSTARGHYRYKQIATSANFLVLSVGGFHRDYSYHCGRSDLHGHRYARSYKTCSLGGFLRYWPRTPCSQWLSDPTEERFPRSGTT